MTRRRLSRNALFIGAAAGPIVVALPLSDEFALPKLAFALLVAAVLLVVVDIRTAWERWAARPLPLLGAGAMLLSLTLATIASDHPRTSVLGSYTDYNGVLYYVPGVVAFAAAVAIVRSSAAVERLVSMLAIGAIPVLAYAAVQLADADPVAWDINFGRRVFSTFGQPLVLGGYLATILPLLAWLAMRRRGGERIFLIGETAVAAVMLLATGTRGAYIGAIVAAAFVAVAVIVLRGVSRRQLAVAVGAMLAVVAVAAGVQASGRMPERLKSAATLTERTDLWRGAVGMTADRPLLGWGPDQFAQEYGRYRPSSERGAQSAYETPSASPHNEFLMILVGGGVTAAAGYVLLLGATVAAAAGALRSSRRRGAALALAAALVAYLAQAQFSIPDASLNVISMTLLGAVVGLSPARRQGAAAGGRAAYATKVARQLALATAAALAMIAIVLVAADYANARGARSLAAARPEAIDRFDLARRLNPVQAAYADDIARAHEASVRWGVPAPTANQRALDAYERRIATFGGGAATHLDAARVASKLLEGQEAMERHLAEAQRLDPKNPGLAAEIAAIRDGAAR